MLAAACSTVAALGHLGCIVFGGDWYRVFGAGEQMAVLADQGHWYPTLVTGALVLILGTWALLALSGAGVIAHLPFLRLGLTLVSAIYLARGLGFYWLMPFFPDNDVMFWLASSSICLLIGSFYAIGTYQQWPHLRRTHEEEVL